MPKVLVVDDALFMRVALSDMLTKWGYEIVGQASNGKEAIEKYKQYQPDIVTMDVTMPIMNGVDALEQIVQQDPHAKVVMVTALGQHKLMKRALQSGAKEFITKPFEPSRLKEVLDQVLTM
ncbi:response regulator [Caryophanon tenue]|uniref:Two-component system response regulator n=1 Tax=Caryophanon tenue TaxID=33978 RepID=A0A1C0Y734_9BACL|nr:response regulator [Caryophanon tenue]OCS82976.1 two-component system response regulator [Caryophanon tenue]